MGDDVFTVEFPVWKRFCVPVAGQLRRIHLDAGLLPATLSVGTAHLPANLQGCGEGPHTVSLNRKGQAHHWVFVLTSVKEIPLLFSICFPLAAPLPGTQQYWSLQSLSERLLPALLQPVGG